VKNESTEYYIIFCSDATSVYIDGNVSSTSNNIGSCS